MAYRITLGLGEPLWQGALGLAGWRGSAAGGRMLGGMLELDGGAWGLEEACARFREASEEDFVAMVREEALGSGGDAGEVADVDGAAEWWMGAHPGHMLDYEAGCCVVYDGAAY